MNVDPELVEASDIEICASGFDNLLLSAEQQNLRDYHEMLVEIKAPKCAAIIKELIDWVDGGGSDDPFEIVLADKSRYHELWRKYDDASCEEEPQELVKAFE